MKLVGKLAFVLWSIFPRQVSKKEHINSYWGYSAEYKVIWFGKVFNVTLDK